MLLRVRLGERVGGPCSCAFVKRARRKETLLRVQVSERAGQQCYCVFVQSYSAGVRYSCIIANEYAGGGVSCLIC